MSGRRKRESKRANKFQTKALDNQSWYHFEAYHWKKLEWERWSLLLFCWFRKGFWCAFGMAPSHKLWYKIKDLSIPKQFRVVIHGIYEEVRAKIKTNIVTSESFKSSAGVKQGYPLSLALFDLYIDKLGEFLNLKAGKSAPLEE